jgi:hypothetical protein
MAYGKKSADWDFDQTQKKLDAAGDVKIAARGPLGHRQRQRQIRIKRRIGYGKAWT